VIGRLTGRVVDDGADGVVVIDVTGVGYEVVTPLGTLGRAAAEAAGAVMLWVHTHAREDALTLFGFATRDDRAAFRSLISVSNVGPKIALSILGVLTAPELAVVLARREVGKLTAIPGVGKKTAERLVLELKDKIVAAPVGTEPAAAPGGPRNDPKAEVLRSALTRLGFRPSEADRAVAALAERIEAVPLAELVREALAVLAR
jgi:Holliday junction DNA helicase RuvA